MRQFLDSKKENDHLEDFSFRERRQIQRHGVIHSCDKMIGKFSDILLDASSIRPAINISSILGLKEHQPNGINSRFNSMNNPFSKNKNEAKDILKKNEKSEEKSLFEKFLYHLDLSATSFSHLDYTKSMSHINDAKKIQNELKDLVDSLIRMRTGSYVCKDMRIETKVRQLENIRNGIQEADYAHTKEQNQKIHESRRTWTWILGILGSMIIGCIIGYDVASSKKRRVLL